MKLETLARLLEATPTGRACGRVGPGGVPCAIIGLEPTGRCYLHGASAPRGPRRAKRKMTKAERRALVAQVRKRLIAVGALPARLPRGRGRDAALRGETLPLDFPLDDMLQDDALLGQMTDDWPEF